MSRTATRNQIQTAVIAYSLKEVLARKVDMLRLLLKAQESATAMSRKTRLLICLGPWRKIRHMLWSMWRSPLKKSRGFSVQHQAQALKKSRRFPVQNQAQAQQWQLLGPTPRTSHRRFSVQHQAKDLKISRLFSVQDQACVIVCPLMKGEAPRVHHLQHRSI